jgi:hypothetical protein
MSASLSSRSAVLVALSLAFFSAPAAQASPWTQPQGKLAVKIGADYQWAKKEWLIDGSFQEFPLNGEYFGGNLRLGVRYGITARLEVGAEMQISHVQYEADEVWLGPPLSPDASELPTGEAIVDSVLSLDRSATGVGDVNVWVKVRVSPLDFWRVIFTPSVEFKIPTGYDAPTGTSVDDDPAQGVSDDVTLGDGQLDITIRAHGGFVPHPRWFIRIDAGFRARFFGPGQQVVGGAKTGVRIGKFFIPYVEGTIEHSITEGKVVGTTFATSTPEKPAREFRLANIDKQLDYRLDRSILIIRAGTIFSMPAWEVDIGYSGILWGRNMSRVHTISVGVTLKL